MNLLRALFGKKQNSSNTKKRGEWFTTSKEELKEFLIDLGKITIEQETIRIENYPFEPSIAYRQIIFKASEIDNINTDSFPPTIKIGNELIFSSAEKKDALAKFAVNNKIKTVSRPDLWGWILEPFLDTEFTEEHNQRLIGLLEKYGLTEKIVLLIRAEVKNQMLKYNFDTMLWDWTHLDASDVLRAMRTKYDKEKFKEFYNEVMRIALLTEVTKD